ncbi:hypothetical protein DES43_102225 [Aquamicrobium defluvii]|uniref:Uncharacterized protein n=1 Tax=Aquamicrobium defluvii TaxID=69279 RepID=A0A4R6YKK9_9HYPH|nr:hypothetical protein DES43_102225 [Aquamicrobium defluvii]
MIFGKPRHGPGLPSVSLQAVRQNRNGKSPDHHSAYVTGRPEGESEA